MFPTDKDNTNTYCFQLFTYSTPLLLVFCYQVKILYEHAIKSFTDILHLSDTIEKQNCTRTLNVAQNQVMHKIRKLTRVQQFFKNSWEKETTHSSDETEFFMVTILQTIAKPVDVVFLPSLND